MTERAEGREALGAQPLTPEEEAVLRRIATEEPPHDRDVMNVNILRLLATLDRDRAAGTGGVRLDLLRQAIDDFIRHQDGFDVDDAEAIAAGYAALAESPEGTGGVRLREAAKRVIEANDAEGYKSGIARAVAVAHTRTATRRYGRFNDAYYEDFAAALLRATPVPVDAGREGLVTALFGPPEKQPDETQTAFTLRQVQRDAADRALRATARTEEEPRLREAYIEALVTAWEQAHYISAQGVQNATAIVSNIEERFKAFVPDWREASAAAALRATTDAAPAPHVHRWEPNTTLDGWRCEDETCGAVHSAPAPGEPE